MFPYFWNIIRLLFPFRYPMKLLTLIFGGMLTSRCMWSGHTSPSTISLPLSIGIIAAGSLWFLSVSRRKILFACTLVQTRCGTCNSTLCVLKYYCHCLALPYNVLLVFFAWLAGRASTLPHQEFFLLFHRLSSTEPRHYGGVFDIQKTAGRVFTCRRLYRTTPKLRSDISIS